MRRRNGNWFRPRHAQRRLARFPGKPRTPARAEPIGRDTSLRPTFSRDKRQGIDCVVRAPAVAHPRGRVRESGHPEAALRRIPAGVLDSPVTGPATEDPTVPLGSLVAEPMRRARLFLADEAAPIVPPTGAGGLTLAGSDVPHPW